MDKGKEGPESVMGGDWARERLCQHVECGLLELWFPSLAAVSLLGDL